MMNTSTTTRATTGRPNAGTPRAPRRRGFTLVEMMVSLAVLALALSVVGVVFTATTTAASQAAAYSEAHAWVSQWMREIKKDLDGCNPAESVLIMVGRTQAASLTQSDLEALKYYRVLTGNPASVQPANYDPDFAPNLDLQEQYSNPRADMLAFFTNRAAVSQAPRLGNAPPDYLTSGGKQDHSFVVYGHAALDDPVWTGSNFVFPRAVGSPTVRHIEEIDAQRNRNPLVQSRIPATRWHLARRTTILVDSPSLVIHYFGPLDHNRLRLCQASVPLGGDVAWFTLFQSPNGYPGYFDEFGPASSFTPLAALQNPYVFMDYAPAGQRNYIYGLLYRGARPERPMHVATVLEEVPVELASNLALHMLPGCAWFQVEFLMPEDPRNSVEFSPDRSAGALSSRYDMPRWTSLPPYPGNLSQGVTYVFVPDSPENRRLVASQVDNSGMPFGRLAAFARLDQTLANDGAPPPAPYTVISNRIIRMWPYAIRITVRVFDRQGRLKEPIIRSVVHRFE